MFRWKRRGPATRFVTYPEPSATTGDAPFSTLDPWAAGSRGDQATGLAAGARSHYQGLYLG